MEARDGSMVAVRKNMVWGDGRISVAPWGGDGFRRMGVVSSDTTESMRPSWDYLLALNTCLGNPVKWLAGNIRFYKKLCVPFCAKYDYEEYKRLVRFTQLFYGCNIKRALRKEGVRGIRIRHKTRNGYWVWMK